ncbi:gliding motility-associated C-terminal domain-containing protein [Aequorivita capsosiphonis]|uniref:T9SS type B sorting domain-containing protein n=1 Tax=Aequorivita capsosiphonis TaxID=487317 RepID=UPI0004249648|nr:gliding motility-associated C-terminal domain-containing protein [Aequorivita capsosiphonis]
MNKKLLLYLQSCHYFFKANFRQHALALFSFLLISFSAFAQGPGCPNVFAGDDVALDCDEPCTDLTASYLNTGETSSYAVSSIPYEPPFPFTGGTPVSVDTDDVWSNAIQLPFDFCFFGETYTEMVIGSNAAISFDLNANSPGGYCGWSFDESIPNPNLFSAAIFGPYMDVDPSVSGSGQINWTVFGEAPCRTMVVNFPGIPFYSSSCNNLELTSQVVIYETTNVVEVYVEDRSNGCTWNDGNAVLGIQNEGGSQGYTPPGRNTGNWSASNEAWRFTPDGESNVEFTWLDSNGEVIGTEPTLNVCPTEASTVYTAQAVYTNCNGDVVTESDDVTVTRTGSFTLNLGGDQELCDTPSYEITAEVIDGNPADATFLWSTGETTQSITVTDSGTYTVDVSIGTCTLIGSVDINFNERPLFDLGDNMETCFSEPVILDATPSNYNPTDATYEWSLDGTVLADETNPTLNASDYGVYTVTVDVAGCSATDEVTISEQDLQVSLGEDLESCFEGSETLTAQATGFNPSDANYTWKLDGETIEEENSSTLIIYEIGTYTVTASIGSCSATDSIDVTFKDDLEVTIEGGDFQTCPKEEHTLKASTRENGATYQWYLNGDILTGETNSTIDIMLEPGTMGSQIYLVEISAGGCTGSDSVEVSLYDLTNCVITQGISPNNDGFNDSLELSWLNDRSGIVKLKIYNRYGTLVFDQRDYSNQWNGQSDKGNELPTGTYFYVIDLKNVDAVYGSRTTGWIYLNRKAN